MMRRLFNLFALMVGILLLLPFAGLPQVAPVAARAPRIPTARRSHAEAGVSLRKRRRWYDGTPMLRDQFRNITALEVALRAIFYSQLTAVADPNREILGFFNTQTSTKPVERNQGIGGFGDVPEYKGALEYDSFELLYRKSYEHVEYAKGMAVERKLIDDDEYGVIRQRAERLGLAFDRTMYKHAAGVFNNAFSATTDAMTGGDGKALCATDHPLSPSSADTQSNKGTSALTYDAVIATEQAMMQFTDEHDEPLTVMPDTLLVPVALKEVAQTIVGSQGKPGTANNDSNNAQGYRVVVSRYLTDANNWFLIDSRMAKLYLNWYWRVRPEYVADPTSDFNLMSKFRGYMRYSYGFDHWAWIYGHQVS